MTLKIHIDGKARWQDRAAVRETRRRVLRWTQGPVFTAVNDQTVILNIWNTDLI